MSDLSHIFWSRDIAEDIYISHSQGVSSSFYAVSSWITSSRALCIIKEALLLEESYSQVD